MHIQNISSIGSYKKNLSKTRQNTGEIHANASFGSNLPRYGGVFFVQKINANGSFTALNNCVNAFVENCREGKFEKAADVLRGVVVHRSSGEIREFLSKNGVRSTFAASLGDKSGELPKRIMEGISAFEKLSQFVISQQGAQMLNPIELMLEKNPKAASIFLDILSAKATAQDRIFVLKGKKFKPFESAVQLVCEDIKTQKGAKGQGMELFDKFLKLMTPEIMGQMGTSLAVAKMFMKNFKTLMDADANDAALKLLDKLKESPDSVIRDFSIENLVIGESKKTILANVISHRNDEILNKVVEIAMGLKGDPRILAIFKAAVKDDKTPLETAARMFHYAERYQPTEVLNWKFSKEMLNSGETFDKIVRELKGKRGTPFAKVLRFMKNNRPEDGRYDEYIQAISNRAKERAPINRKAKQYK